MSIILIVCLVRFSSSSYLFTVCTVTLPTSANSPSFKSDVFYEQCSTPPCLYPVCMCHVYQAFYHFWFRACSMYSLHIHAISIDTCCIHKIPPRLVYLCTYTVKKLPPILSGWRSKIFVCVIIFLPSGFVICGAITYIGHNFRNFQHLFITV
jgi:hypothetical protein